MITQTVDDSIVMSLDVHLRNPAAMWKQLADDFNTVTPPHLRAARREFENLAFPGSETSLEMKQTFNELVRHVTVQGGVLTSKGRLDTLLNSLPKKYGFSLNRTTLPSLHQTSTIFGTDCSTSS